MNGKWIFIFLAMALCHAPLWLTVLCVCVMCGTTMADEHATSRRSR